MFVAGLLFFLAFWWFAGFVLFLSSRSLVISLSSMWELGGSVDISGGSFAVGGESVRKMDSLGGSSSCTVVGVGSPSASVGIGGSMSSGVAVLGGVTVPWDASSSITRSCGNVGVHGRLRFLLVSCYASSNFCVLTTAYPAEVLAVRMVYVIQSKPHVQLVRQGPVFVSYYADIPAPNHHSVASLPGLGIADFSIF